MVAGPTDVGKSSLCRLLVNYGVRMGRRPVYVDLDVGQGSISVPGTIGATIVEEPLNIEDSFDQNISQPLVYSFGHKSPGHNKELYNQLVTKLSQGIREQFKNNRKAETSGMIINTCGWIKGQGYQHLKHIAQAFEVDIIIVLDEERLYQDLVQDMPKFVKISWLPRSTGVFTRDQENRKRIRNKKVQDYFYGGKKQFEPHSFEIKNSELEDKLFKLSDPMLIVKQGENPIFNLERLQPKRFMVNRLLALSFATDPDELASSNVAGFLWVTSVDEKKIKVLSPQPLPLPECYFLMTEIEVDLR